MTDATAGHAKGPFAWAESAVYTGRLFYLEGGDRSGPLGEVCERENAALVALAPTAPHDCGDEECPGYRLLKALQTAIGNAYAHGPFCNEGRAPTAHAPGCWVATIEEAIRDR